MDYITQRIYELICNTYIRFIFQKLLLNYFRNVFFQGYTVLVLGLKSLRKVQPDPGRPQLGCRVRPKGSYATLRRVVFMYFCGQGLIVCPPLRPNVASNWGKNAFFKARPVLSGVGPANQTKERAKTKNVHEFRPFFCEFWCFSLGKQARFTY